MNHYKPEKVFVERGVENSRITRNVLDQLPGVPVQYLHSTDHLLQQSKHWNPGIARAKKSLVLARHRGQFFKACPAGQARHAFENTCCNYFVLNYASNCHLECSYCYLQSYLNFPYMIVYANCGDLLSELESVLKHRSSQFHRIGTGELADSLALDPLTSYSIPLVNFFARQDNAILEFKTKSNCVENILDLEHRGHTVVSWSVNSHFVQEREEHKTATIEKRLGAAESCVRSGYPVAFHLDPLVFYPGWETDYKDLVERIFERIPAASVPWISIGVLRMSQSLKELVRERFPHSFLPLGELVPCEDGKFRYFKLIRLMMFQKVLGWIRAKTTTTSVYTCMEGPHVWSKVFGSPPPNETQLGRQIIEPLVPLA